MCSAQFPHNLSRILKQGVLLTQQASIESSSSSFFRCIPLKIVSHQSSWTDKLLLHRWHEPTMFSKNVTRFPQRVEGSWTLLRWRQWLQCIRDLCIKWQTLEVKLGDKTNAWLLSWRGERTLGDCKDKKMHLFLTVQRVGKRTFPVSKPGDVLLLCSKGDSDCLLLLWSANKPQLFSIFQWRDALIPESF